MLQYFSKSQNCGIWQGMLTFQPAQKLKNSLLLFLNLLGFLYKVIWFASESNLECYDYRMYTGISNNLSMMQVSYRFHSVKI